MSDESTEKEFNEQTAKQFNKETARPLIGCTSFETAYVQPDYPYGQRLRCQRRVWIETNPRYGMRFVSRTTNPKRRGEVWNTPHAGTYADLKALWVDDKGFVASDGLLGDYSNLESVKAWGERNQALIEADEYVRNKYNGILRQAEAYEERKKAGQVKLRVTKTEWIPGQGMVKTSEEVITVQ